MILFHFQRNCVVGLKNNYVGNVFKKEKSYDPKLGCSIRWNFSSLD